MFYAMKNIVQKQATSYLIGRYTVKKLCFRLFQVTLHEFGRYTASPPLTTTIATITALLHYDGKRKFFQIQNGTLWRGGKVYAREIGEI